MMRTADITRSALRLAISARPLGERGTRLSASVLPLVPAASPAPVVGNACARFTSLCADYAALNSKFRVDGQEAWPPYQSHRHAHRATTHSGEAGP
jgi:hypothetical protein